MWPSSRFERSARSVYVLATDLGQATAVYPDEGLALYGERLLANGFSEADIRTMIVKNPASLIG